MNFVVGRGWIWWSICNLGLSVVYNEVQWKPCMITGHFNVQIPALVWANFGWSRGVCFQWMQTGGERGWDQEEVFYLTSFIFSWLFSYWSSTWYYKLSISSFFSSLLWQPRNDCCCWAHNFTACATLPIRWEGLRLTGWVPCSAAWWWWLCVPVALWVACSLLPFGPWLQHPLRQKRQQTSQHFIIHQWKSGT